MPRVCVRYCDDVDGGVGGGGEEELARNSVCVFVRRRDDLQAGGGSESSGRAYIPVTSSEDCYSPCDISGELTKPPRALWLWFCVRLFGLGAWRRTLSSRLGLAADAHARLGALPGIVVHSPLSLSTFTFRCGEGGNARTKDLLHHINATGTVFCSPTTLDGDVFVIRCCVVCFRTSVHEVNELERAVRTFLLAA